MKQMFIALSALAYSVPASSAVFTADFTAVGGWVTNCISRTQCVMKSIKSDALLPATFTITASGDNGLFYLAPQHGFSGGVLRVAVANDAVERISYGSSTDGLESHWDVGRFSFYRYSQDSIGQYVSKVTNYYAVSGNYTLDGVSIGGLVPEPSLWAMMILGFGFIGCAMRRGKSARLLPAKHA